MEFVGGLAGHDVAGLTVSTTAPAATSEVTETVAADAGLTEIKYLTFSLPRVQPTPVSAAVVTTRKAQTAIGEQFAIEFTTPYFSKGFYQISLGGQTESVRFVNNDITNNTRYIREAVADLAGVSTGSVSVFFDQGHPNQHHYYVRFTGSAASTSLAGLAVSDSFNSGDARLLCASNSRGTYLEAGRAARGETQQVSLSRDEAAGVFTLAFASGGTDYATDEVPFGATATQVRDALVAHGRARRDVQCDEPGERRLRRDVRRFAAGRRRAAAADHGRRLHADPRRDVHREHRWRDIRSDRLPGGRRGPGGGDSRGSSNR